MFKKFVVIGMAEIFHLHLYFEIQFSRQDIVFSDDWNSN